MLDGKAGWSVSRADAVEWLTTLPDLSVDLVIGSPPYPEKGGRYRDKIKQPKLGCREWIDLMFAVTLQARRACRGDVVWVVNNTVKDGGYIPAVEGLLWKWYESGQRLERPVVWTKNSTPNRRDWFGNSWEYVICFPGESRVWNWEEIATPKKYSSGGRFRQRTANGERKLGNAYPTNPLARPRDVIHCTVGGGHMGHKLAHENEAPFPVKLIVPFVKALTNPGDVVADPFAGSSTTGHAALILDRRYVGADNRQSQVDLSTERLDSLVYHGGF